MGSLGQKVKYLSTAIVLEEETMSIVGSSLVPAKLQGLGSVTDTAGAMGWELLWEKALLEVGGLDETKKA